MSAVISSAKQFYRQALIYEGLVLSGVALASALFIGQGAWSVLCGALSAFLPFCAFAYWVFFRSAHQKSPNSNKMAVFYRAEGIKWLLTILCVGLSFKLLPSLSYLAFFAGYFLGLVGNIALPMWFKRSAI